MHPALFYLPGGRLSLPELTAARLDGHVVEIGEGYLPADTIEGPDARATSLAHLVPVGAALCGPSAAWVHGAGDRPPARHHVCHIDTAAPRPRSDARVTAHALSLAADETTEIGGVLVLRPVTVSLDLALGALRDPEYRRWLEALDAVAPELAGRAHAALAARRRIPGKRAALALLAELADQDVVTR